MQILSLCHLRDDLKMCHCYGQLELVNFGSKFTFLSENIISCWKMYIAVYSRGVQPFLWRATRAIFKVVVGRITKINKTQNNN